jgi:hypothetical protein
MCSVVMRQGKNGTAGGPTVPLTICRLRRSHPLAQPVRVN